MIGRMKHCEQYFTAEIAENIKKFSFAAFSASSAVNCYVSFSIRLAVFQANGGVHTE